MYTPVPSIVVAFVGIAAFFLINCLFMHSTLSRLEVPPAPSSFESFSALEKHGTPKTSEKSTDTEGSIGLVKSASSSAGQERNMPPQILRVDWTNLPVRSPIAKVLSNHYNNCSIPVRAIHRWRRATAGLGAELHTWGNALYHAYSQNVRFRHLRGPRRHKSDDPWLEWPWLDLDECLVNKTEVSWNGTISNLSCYFPSITQPNCNGQDETDEQILLDATKKPKEWSIPEWRAATTEFLFSSVSPLIIHEAERQVQQVFSKKKPPPSNNLIAIHVRWGDKKVEADLMPIEDYVSAAKKIIQEQQIEASSVNILLCSEDPAAIEAFREAAPSHWKIFIDQMFTELLPYRSNTTSTYSHFVHTARKLRGKPGLWALGSLLVSMEANYFVLGTVSNWSRLINELRTHIIDPRCDNCTVMIDVSPAPPGSHRGDE